MGLLDFLNQPDSGNGISGLLSYLQQPLYSGPILGQRKEDDAAFSNALRGGSTEGALPQLTASAAPVLTEPQPNIWSQPGINYAPAPAAPAPSVFASGAPGFATGLPSAVPQAPASQPAGPLSAAPPQAAPPAPENNPINSMNIGGYQMPQFGSAADYTPQPQIAARPATDISAQSRQPPQELPPAFGGSGYLDRVNNGGGLIGSMLGDTAQQKNLAAQYNAIRQTLEASGTSPREAQSKAMLAVMNPEAGKTILNEALTSKEKYQKVGVDGLGNETYGFVNERDQTINGKALGADSGQSSGGFLAPGVKSIDSSLTGGDYLKQFSPEVQAAVQNYVDGKSMPTGNPRKGFTQTVKMIAQKYGADTNQTVDDATYSARRTMRNQLSSSAPSSLGGQINIGNTAAGHLADLTQKAIDLGNVDTGIAPLTSAVNSVRGLGTEQAAKMEALKGAAQHYGQEITKFYAGSPGGVAERDRFIESVNGARSPKELAAILSTEAELMRSRLDALGGQIKGVLGDEGSKQYPVLRPDGEAALAKVEQNVSRLKGNAPAAASGGIPSGWSVKVH